MICSYIQATEKHSISHCIKNKNKTHDEPLQQNFYAYAPWVSYSFHPFGDNMINSHASWNL